MHDIVGRAWANPIQSCIDVQNMAQLHAHDHHQNVTETSGHRTTQKVQIHGPHRYCEPGYSSVMHTWSFMDCAAQWQHIICSAGHMGHLHQAGMD